MNPNECVLCVCVKIWHLLHICDRKYRFEINFYVFINDYSLIADLHIFVYGRAECATISLECTKVKLLILDNFGKNVKNLLKITGFLCQLRPRRVAILKALTL